MKKNALAISREAFDTATLQAASEIAGNMELPYAIGTITEIIRASLRPALLEIPFDALDELVANWDDTPIVYVDCPALAAIKEFHNGMVLSELVVRARPVHIGAPHRIPCLHSAPCDGDCGRTAAT